MPLDESEFRPKVLLSRRMANLCNKFVVSERFIIQFRLSGLVIHVVFKPRARASSKYDGGDFKALSFFTTRHFFKYARFLTSKQDSHSAETRFRSAG